MKKFVDGEWNFQGEVAFRRVNGVPKGAEKEKVQGDIVVGHSETGHHHVFEASPSVFLYSTKDQFVSYLEIKQPAVLKHQRAWDTHEEIEFPVGVFEIRRQREYAPEGWKRVID